MSSPEKQVSGGELQSSISQCSSQSLAIPATDFTSQHPACPTDRNVSLDSPPLKTTLPEDAVIGHQQGTESTAILSTNSLASLIPSSHVNKNIETERIDDTTSQTQERFSHEASGPQSLTFQNVEETGRPSLLGTECTDTTEMVQEMHECNVMQQSASAECSTGDTTAAVTTATVPESPASMGCHISSSKHAQFRENLPRLALLDLPFLGITPPSQDISERPQTLEGIQEAPHSSGGAMGSSADEDLNEKSQVSRIGQSPLQEAGSIPEAMPKVAVSGANSVQADEVADDEVTFIVSVPRRRKKKKRAEFCPNRSAEELAGNQKSSVVPDKDSESPGPRCLTPASTRPPSVHQTSQITGRQDAIPADIPNNSVLPALASTAQTAGTNQESQECSQFDKADACDRGVSKAASIAQNSVPVLTGRAGATAEAASTKRKVNQSGECLQSDGQDNEPPMKKAKIVDEKQGQVRSAASPANHGHNPISTQLIGCATTLKAPSATSLNMGSSNPGISNSQLHGHDASNLVTHITNYRNQAAGSANRAMSPRSAQADNVRTPIGRMSVQNNLRDVRRKPSLYSIPVWSPTPSSSCTSGSQITTTGVSGVTRSIDSPPSAPGQIPVSQTSQRSTSNNSISSSTTLQSPSSAQIRTGSSQAFYVPRSLDHQNRSTQPLGAQTVYAISSWPPNQRFLTTGQQVRPGFPPQSQHFTFTPQEWARIQAAKNGESQQANSNSAVSKSPQMRRAESLPQNPSSQTAEQSQPPSPNLLVDIAQTCQAIFPFARIAERHNQPVKKVFDAFSAVIQIPLLQCAADRRRNGKLGTARLKKFREVSKAVNEQHEKERKAKKEGEKMRNELAEPPAKRPKGRPPKSAAAKGLLGMALANSQKNAGGSK